MKVILLTYFIVSTLKASNPLSKDCFGIITVGLFAQSTGLPGLFTEDEKLKDIDQQKTEKPHEDNIYSHTHSYQHENEIEDDVMKMRRFRNECIVNTRAKPALVEKLKNGNWKINNPALQNWSLCVLNKMDLMSHEGVFKLDVAMARLNNTNKSFAEKVIDECLRRKKYVPPAIVAWHYLQCHHTKSKGNLTAIGIF